MGRLQNLLLKHELHPRVAHRLPGRLRLHLPALKRLAPLNGDVTPWLEGLLALPPGVDKVSVNTRTGSVLIHYQPDDIDETGILGHVQTLSAGVRDLWPRLKHLDPQHDADSIRDCLCGLECPE